MAKITKVLQKLSSEALADGEEIRIGLRVNLKGTALGVGLSAGLGGVLGAVVGSKKLNEGIEQAKESGIPFSQQMALGLTDSRIIVWSRSQMSGKPKEIIGEIPLTDIGGVTFEKGKMGDLIGLKFSDDKILELESIKVDKGEDFTKALEASIS